MTGVLHACDVVSGADERVWAFRWQDVALVHVHAPDPAPESRLAQRLGLVPCEAQNTTAPDLRIRVQARKRTAHTAGRGRTAADDGTTSLVWPTRHGTVKWLDPGSALGCPNAPLDLVCGPNTAPDALARPWLHVVALEHGLLPMHAAAFVWHERTTLLVGASGAGKTALLLAALLSGATLAAAEWVCVSAPQSTARGGDDALRMRAWHLASLPELCGLLRPDETRRLQRRISYATFVRRLPHVVTRAIPAVARLERRWFVDMAAARFMSTNTRPWPISRIVFVRANQPVFHVQPLAKTEAHARLLAIAAADDAALVASARTSTARHFVLRPTRIEACSAARSAAIERLLHNAETMTVDLPQHGFRAATVRWLQSA
jgi:hypothetical protein